MSADGVRAFLDGVEARRAAATPGPWAQQRGFPTLVYGDPSVGMFVCDTGVESLGGGADAEFIAAAPETQRRLVAAIEAVLDLHRTRDDAWCDGCEFGWPCQTYCAVAAHLDPKENPHG